MTISQRQSVHAQSLHCIRLSVRVHISPAPVHTVSLLALRALRYLLAVTDHCERDRRKRGRDEDGGSLHMDRDRQMRGEAEWRRQRQRDRGAEADKNAVSPRLTHRQSASVRMLFVRFVCDCEHTADVPPSAPSASPCSVLLCECVCV